jgi:uncharacterized membrane protein YtjA (UPF0391 family)
MKSLIFLVIAVVLTISGSYARGPAVEDFVGIESEEMDLTPAGTHALFNFEKELRQKDITPTQQMAVIKSDIQTSTEQKIVSSQESGVASLLFGVFVILCLPVITWSLTMRHLNNRETQASAESLPDNVTPFPTRSEKSQPKDDDIKKAG